MKKLLISLFAVLAAACAAEAPQIPLRGPAFEGTAIVGATVLPMDGRDRLTDQTVLVSSDRIVAVGPRSKITVPVGARVIDGNGKTLMPGLVDMHVHLAPVPGQSGDAAQRALAVMLAHGVTTARGMAGSPENLVLRAKVESGQLPGPRIYAAAPALNFKTVTSAEAARDAVRKAKSAGYDLVKMHHLTDVAVWSAAQDEARQLGIPTAGHVTNQVGLQRALAAGQQVEHLDSMIFELLPAGHPAKSADFGQIPPPPVIQAVSALPQSEIDSLARRVAAANSWQVPTLSLFETILDQDTPLAALRAAPAMRYVPPQVLDQWAEQHGQLAKSGFSRADSNALIELRRRIAGAIHRAGAPLMAGSDTAQAFHVWGPGLHKEIAALRAAGLSPIDSLKAATVVPRDYFRSLANGGSGLGWKADFGTVTTGARADLILLDGDPLADPAALERPRVVIAGGRIYDRAALDRMLDQAAADASGGAPQTAAVAGQAPVFIIRHLQKSSGDDPSLTAEGRANAVKLADLLAGKGIAAIYATETKRAKETAATLAQRLRIQVTPYDPRDPAGLVAAARATNGPVLVVGHSNTVPELVERFGGTRPADIPETDYGTLFVVDPAGTVTTVELR